MNTSKTKKVTTAKTPRSQPGSGNVFADLGFDNPEDMLAKAELKRQARNFKELEKRMSPESIARSNAKAKRLKNRAN